MVAEFGQVIRTTTERVIRRYGATQSDEQQAMVVRRVHHSRTAGRAGRFDTTALDTKALDRAERFA